MVNLFVIVLFYIFALYFIYSTVFQIMNINYSMNYVKYPIKKKINSKKHIIILIPVLEEYKIINETISYFSKIIKNRNVSLYFITTEKEGSLYKNKTFQVIRKNIKGSIKNIHYPYKIGDKSHQLNYAINLLKGDYKNLNNYYIGIFDCDSRPDPRGFDYIINDNISSFSYQMFTIYSDNYNELSLINKANAIFQSRWSLSFEMPHAIKNYKKGYVKNLMYFIGHGLFIKFDELICKKIPEDTITEDLSLGYDYSFNNKTWKVVPYFDYSTVPTSILTNIVQSSRWFYGELLLIKNYIRYIKKFGLSLRPSLLLVKRYFHILQWLIGGPFIFMLLILSFYLKEYILSFLIFIGVFLYVYVLHSRMKRFFPIRIKDYIFILIKSLVNFLGPVYGVIRMILTLLNIKKYDFIKTKR